MGCYGGSWTISTSFSSHIGVLVTQSYLSFVTPWTVAGQAPLSREFFLARILEWVAISSSKGSFQPRDQTHVSCVSRIDRQLLYCQKKLRMEVSCNCLHNLLPKGLRSTSLQVQETKRIKRMEQAYLMDMPIYALAPGGL